MSVGLAWSDIYALLKASYKVIEPRTVKLVQYERLSLTDRMLDAWRNQSFTLTAIVGGLGSGKTYYATTAACQFLKLISRVPPGVPRAKCMEIVVKKYMVFTATREQRRDLIAALPPEKAEKIAWMPSLQEAIEMVDWRDPLPVLIWDDAGVYGMSYKFFTERRTAEALAALFQVLRRRVRNMIMTTPAIDFLLKVIRSIPERFIILMRPIDVWWSEARGYAFLQGPKSEYVKLVFRDKFYKKVPDEFHNYYMEISNLYVDAALSLLGGGRREVRARGVLEALYELSGGRPWVYVPRRMIMEYTGRSEREVKEAIKNLVAAGYAASLRAKGTALTPEGVRAAREILFGGE